MKLHAAYATLLWTCFLQAYGAPVSLESGIDREQGLDKRVPAPAIIPDLPLPVPVVPKPLVIPKPADPIPAPAPQPAPNPVPKPGDTEPAPAPKPGNSDPAPAPPASKPKDIEPDEAALCKRTGCDLTPERLTRIRQKSEDQQTILDNAIKNNQPDTGSKQSIVPLYARDDPVDDLPVAQSQAWFLQFGIQNEGESWKSLVVKNSEKQLQRIEEGSRPPILKTYQSPNQGAILITKSENKEEDVLVTDSIEGTPATPWSDMVMDNWRFTAGNNNAQGLIDQALKLMGKDPSENIKLEIPRPTATSSQAEKDAYNTLAGTVHVDRVVKMLKDHHQELGDLNIQSIFVVKNGVEYNLAIQLTKAS